MNKSILKSAYNKIHTHICLCVCMCGCMCVRAHTSRDILTTDRHVSPRRKNGLTSRSVVGTLP
jgi:hypothetical protein